jgi:hypothetical protein
MEKINRPRCIRNFKKEKIPLESEEQKELFKWKDRMISKGYKELWGLNSSLNGMRMTPGMAMKAKACGMVAGFPDINLPVGKIANGKMFLGLYIELKRIKGSTISPEQRKWEEYLKGNDYGHRFCFGWIEAAKTICEYLGIDVSNVQ